MPGWLRLLIEIALIVASFLVGVPAGQEIERARQRPVKTLWDLKHPKPTSTTTRPRLLHREEAEQEEVDGCLLQQRRVEKNYRQLREDDVVRLPPHWWTPERDFRIVNVDERRPVGPVYPAEPKVVPRHVPKPEVISTPAAKPNVAPCPGGRCPPKAQQACPGGKCGPTPRTPLLRRLRLR